MEAQEIPGAIPFTFEKAGPHARLNWMKLSLFGLHSAGLQLQGPTVFETPQGQTGRKKSLYIISSNKQHYRHGENEWEIREMY